MFAAHADAFDGKHLTGKAERFALPRTAVIEPERQIDEPYIETEEPDHRPGADRDETDADGEADKAEKSHQQPKIARSQTAVRQQHSLEGRPSGSFGTIGTCTHASEA